MFVSSYPSLASSVAEDGQTLARVRRVDATSVTPGNFEQVTEPVHVGAAMGFPLAYTMDAAGFEGGTDTGGALIDPSSNTLYGVVSSRGVTSGEVYVSRVEYLASWIGAIAQCTPPPISAQCHPVPPPPCDGGGSSSGSSGGGSSSGSSSGGEGSSSGSGSGGGSGGGSGSSGGSGGSGGSGSSSGSGGGWSSSGGGGGGGGDDGGTCNPPPPPPPPPSTGGDDGGGGGDDGGGNGGSSSGGSGSSSGIFGGSGGGGTASSSSGSGSSGGRTPYPGPGEPLIPDGPGCYDDTCGGCANDPSCDDGQQDYGDCGCEPAPPYEAGPTQ
jgi:hypothetical protein